MYDRPQRDADCSSKGDWKGMENVSVQDIVLATGGVLLSGDDGVMLNKIRLDSRQVETGDLFVPIIGEKVDAHKFLEQVAEKGAGAVLTSEHKDKTEEMAEFHLKGPHVACLYHLTTAGPLTAGELCDRCDEDKAAISRSLDFLEKEGYLVCDSSARKRYRSPLRLSEKGEATGRRIMEKIDRIVREAGSALTEEERAVMYRALSAVSERLAQMGETKTNEAALRAEERK